MQQPNSQTVLRSQLQPSTRKGSNFSIGSEDEDEQRMIDQQFRDQHQQHQQQHQQHQQHQQQQQQQNDYRGSQFMKTAKTTAIKMKKYAMDTFSRDQLVYAHDVLAQSDQEIDSQQNQQMSPEFRRQSPPSGSPKSNKTQSDSVEDLEEIDKEKVPLQSKQKARPKCQTCKCNLSVQIEQQRNSSLILLVKLHVFCVMFLCFWLCYLTAMIEVHNSDCLKSYYSMGGGCKILNSSGIAWFVPSYYIYCIRSVSWYVSHLLYHQQYEYIVKVTTTYMVIYMQILFILVPCCFSEYVKSCCYKYFVKFMMSTFMQVLQVIFFCGNMSFVVLSAVTVSLFWDFVEYLNTDQFRLERFKHVFYHYTFIAVKQQKPKKK